jgi:hypothetical protein
MMPNMWSVIRSIPTLRVLVRVTEYWSEVNLHQKMLENVGMPGQNTGRLISAGDSD